MNHKFYPEQWPGKGLKCIRYVLERIYCIYSMTMINDEELLLDSSDENLDLGQDTLGLGIVLNEPQMNSLVRMKLKRATYSYI